MIAVAALLCAAVAPANHCLRFEGDGEVAIVPYQKAMDAAEITIEAWIKVDATATERFYNYIVCRNYGDFGWGIAIHGSPVKVFSQAPGVSVPIDRWTHVALVCSRRAGKFYVDGQLASAWERKGELKPFEHRLMIGNSDFTGEPGRQRTPFRGCIDELRIWSIPRTQLQIRRTMRRFLRGNEKGLLAYFPFEEGEGQIIHDFAGHLISGSIGETYTSGEDDPQWSNGPPLAGHTPHPRPFRALPRQG